MLTLISRCEPTTQNANERTYDTDTSDPTFLVVHHFRKFSKIRDWAKRRHRDLLILSMNCPMAIQFAFENTETGLGFLFGPYRFSNATRLEEWL